MKGERGDRGDREACGVERPLAKLPPLPVALTALLLVGAWCCSWVVLPTRGEVSFPGVPDSASVSGCGTPFRAISFRSLLMFQVQARTVKTEKYRIETGSQVCGACVLRIDFGLCMLSRTGSRFRSLFGKPIDFPTRRRLSLLRHPARGRGVTRSSRSQYLMMTKRWHVRGRRYTRCRLPLYVSVRMSLMRFRSPSKYGNRLSAPKREQRDRGRALARV